MNLWGTDGLTLSSLLTIISYAAIGIGFLGSPQVFVRFIAIRDQLQIRSGRWVAVIFTLITDSGAVLTGLLGRSLLVGMDGDFSATLGVSGESVLPMLVEHLFPPIVAASSTGLMVMETVAELLAAVPSLALKVKLSLPL